VQETAHMRARKAARQASARRHGGRKRYARRENGMARKGRVVKGECSGAKRVTVK